MSYITEQQLTDYVADRNVVLTKPLAELLVRSMDYLETLEYVGFKATREQPYQWPRTDVAIDGFIIGSDEIPVELQNGQCEVCIAIDAGLDPLNNVERSVKREKIDVIEVEYMDSSAEKIRLVAVEHALRKLVINTFQVSRA